MTTMRETHAALPLSVLVALTDAAQALFGATYDLERAHKRAIKARASALASELDLFGPAEHYADHEGYVPGGDER
jgi:hypothetical protein